MLMIMTTAITLSVLIKTKDSINGTNVTIRRKKPNNNNNNSNKYNNNNGNNNNNNEISSSNKNSTINKDNVISPSPSQISKETVFILGDSMVKKLNGFLLTRKLKHKCLVNIRPFSSAKARCRHDAGIILTLLRHLNNLMFQLRF